MKQIKYLTLLLIIVLLILGVFHKIIKSFFCKQITLVLPLHWKNSRYQIAFCYFIVYCIHVCIGLILQFLVGIVRFCNFLFQPNDPGLNEFLKLEHDYKPYIKTYYIYNSKLVHYYNDTSSVSEIGHLITFLSMLDQKQQRTKSVMQN